MTNVVLERNVDCDKFVVLDYPPFPTYRAWSERERRWVTMTFNEYQAWLTRPDLDPAQFVPSVLAS